MISAITLKEVKTSFNVLGATEGRTFEAFIVIKIEMRSHLLNLTTPNIHVLKMSRSGNFNFNEDKEVLPILRQLAHEE
jgi:hypothetical protein